MSNSPFTSRAACVAGCVFAFFLTIVITCGWNTPTMIGVLGYDGFFALFWVMGACALGAVVLRGVHFDADAKTGDAIACFTANRLLLFATAGGLGLGIFSILGLLLGLAGLVNRPVAFAFPIGSILLWVVTLLRGGAARHQIDFTPARKWLSQPAGLAWLWIIPVISLALVCVSASILPGWFWKPFDPHPYDVTSYHFQVPREWYEAGRIVPLHHNVFSYFPFNVEMQFLLLMHLMGGPWAGMYACQFISAGYAVLMVIAVAGAASESAAGSAVVGACFASVVPWALMLAGVGYVETGLMLYTALAIAWAMRAVSAPAHLVSRW